jgi:CyaY protein
MINLPLETPMNDTEFNDAVDATLLAIEDAIDTLDIDIDLEMSAGILTLTFENHSKVIINRQAGTKEIWVAARSGGFHCAWHDGTWVCGSTRETLQMLLSRVCREQSGAAIALSF